MVAEEDVQALASTVLPFSTPEVKHLEAFWCSDECGHLPKLLAYAFLHFKLTLLTCYKHTHINCTYLMHTYKCGHMHILMIWSPQQKAVTYTSSPKHFRVLCASWWWSWGKEGENIFPVWRVLITFHVFHISLSQVWTQISSPQKSLTVPLKASPQRHSHSLHLTHFFHADFITQLSYWYFYLLFNCSSSIPEIHSAPIEETNIRCSLLQPQ